MTRIRNEAVTTQQTSKKRLALAVKSGITRSLTAISLMLLLSIPALYAQNIKKLTVDCLNAKNANFKCETHFKSCPDVPGLNLREQTTNPCDCQNSLWILKGSQTDSGVNQDSLVFSTDCKDTIVNATPTNPFHGWWATVTKGNIGGYDPTSSQYVQDDIDSYIFIDTTQSPITITTTAGTNLEPRVPTNLDLAPVVDPAFVTYNQIDATTLVGRYNALGLTGADFSLYPDTIGLKLQADGNTIISTSGVNPFALFEDRATKLIRVPAPKLRPFSQTDVNFKGDVNDPVFLVKYIFDQLMHNGTPQNAHFLCNPADVPSGASCVTCDPALSQPVDCDFVGFRKAYDILNQLLTTGITVTSKITKVRPTNNIYNQLVTDIYTDRFSFATAGSTVTIAGFTGAYQALNGTYVNGVGKTQYGGVPNPNGLHVDYAQDAHGKQTAGTYPFHFLLNADTSSPFFPRVPTSSTDMNSGLGIFTTVPEGATVIVTHRVHSSMEYPEFVAAVLAMFYQIWKVSFHTEFYSFIPTSPSLFLTNTWEELRAQVKAGTFGMVTNGTRTITMRPSIFYNNTTLSFFTTGYKNFLINDPFNVRADANRIWPEIYDYDIVLNNYLQDQASLYWALDQVPSGPWIDVQQNLPVDLGYKQNGKTFVGVVAPYFNGIGQDDTYNLDINTYTLFAGSLSLTPTPNTIRTNKNEMYFGRIKTSLTGGKNIGYIRFRDFPVADPFNLCFTGFFDPSNGTSPKFDREAASRIISAMMKYVVTDLASDAIILDNRGNGGGVTPLYIAEFFGDTRPGFVYNTAYKDDGVALIDQLQDTSRYQTVNNDFAIKTTQTETIFAGYNATTYPGSVFQGTPENPKKVIILTDAIAGSAGDSFPTFFLGANLDKNIGAHVTVEFIGDIDGRLKGQASETNPLPVSENSSFLTDAGGNPVSPILVEYDISFGLFPARMKGTNYFLSQQTPVTAIDAAPLKGTAGGNPLPNDFPEVLWPDLGFITPYPYPQIGEPAPDPAVQSSWNDLWLRQAILVALS